MEKMNVLESETPHDQEWNKGWGVSAAYYLGLEQRLNPLQQLHWFRFITLSSNKGIYTVTEVQEIVQQYPTLLKS